MKAIIATALTKEGQKIYKHFLLCESNIHRDAERMVFNHFGVYDYEQPNDRGISVTDIALSDDIGWLFAVDGNELIEIKLVNKND